MSGRTNHFPEGGIKIVTEKICCKCKIPKPIKDFPRRIECADGAGSVCNVCYKQYQAEIRARKKEWSFI